MTLEDEALVRLLREKESDRVEFKESLSGDSRRRIREAICAFANDLPDRREQGVIIVGVSDDGSATGLQITDELLRQLADMKTDGNILPPPSISVERRMLRGKDVALVTVQPSDSPPVRYNGRVHVRTGPRRGIATAQDERVLNEKRRYRDIPFDVHPIASATLDDLDLLFFEREYLWQAFARDVLDANDRRLEEQLAATKMIASVDDPTPTVLGMLVLGKTPQDYLPGAYVQLLLFDGTELASDIVDSAEILGSVPDVLRRLDEKLNAYNRTTVDFTSAYLERRTSLYPMQAVQQITRNAVMHRTYESTNAPVHVHWLADRIEVTSPGGPFGRVTDENFGKPGEIDYRNPNLADAMKTLGFVQRFGLGIITAQRLMLEAGHPEVEFETSHSSVIAAMRRPSSAGAT